MTGIGFEPAPVVARKLAAPLEDEAKGRAARVHVRWAAPMRHRCPPAWWLSGRRVGRLISRSTARNPDPGGLGDRL